MYRVFGSAGSSGNASSNASIVSSCIRYFDVGFHLPVIAFVSVHKGCGRESGPYHMWVGCEAGHIPGGAG